MGYEIDSSEPSPQFLQARNVAGATLHEEFKSRGGKLEPNPLRPRAFVGKGAEGMKKEIPSNQ